LSGENISWDWPKGRFIIDTPEAVVFAGRTPRAYRFKNGITLRDFNQPFASVAIVSLDGLPLVGKNPSQNVLITAVFDARNTGFSRDSSVQGGPVQVALGISNMGGVPVVVDPVGLSIDFPSKVQAQVKAYDFALRERVSEALEGRTLIIPPQTHWAWQMTGMKMAWPTDKLAPLDPAMDLPRVTASGNLQDESDTIKAYRGLWHPLPGVGWDKGYLATHVELKQSNISYSALNGLDSRETPEKLIRLSDAPTPIGGLADYELRWKDGVPQPLVATLKLPPSFSVAVKLLEKKFGKPLEFQERLQIEESRASWFIPADKAGVKLVLTEAQGIMQLIVEPQLEQNNRETP
jgi:hypothetical protein